MKSLLNSTLVRRLHLIEDLSYSDRPLNIDELFGGFCCSDRTLYRDIKDINDSIDYLKINRNNNELSISYEDGFYIKDVYENIMENELPFKIIEQLLHSDSLSMDQLSVLLHTSVSSIYRMIDSMNDLIGRTYDFVIETNPCLLRGNEADIRAFLFHYLNEKYPFNYWPFSDIDENLLDSFLGFFIDELSIQEDYAFFRYLKLYFALNCLFLRRQRRFEKSKLKVINKISFNNFLKSLSKYGELDRLEENLGLDLNEDSLSQLFFPFLTNGMIMNLQDLENIEDLQPSASNHLRQIYNFITNLSKILLIEEGEKDILAMKIYNILKSSSLSPGADFLLGDRNSKFFNVVVKVDPVLVGQVGECVRGLYRVLNYKVSQNFHLYFMITIFYNIRSFLPSIMLKRQSKKVLLISSLGYNHALMYRQRLSYEISNIILIDIYDRQSLDIDWINSSDYEYIISSDPIQGLSQDKKLYVTGLAPNSSLQQKIIESLNDSL